MTVLISKEKLRHSQLLDLKKYLGVSEMPEDDLITVEDARMPGTCEWLSAKKSFLKWREFAPDTPSVLWIHGKPAAGKSVLAGYAISQLRKANLDCSYFFFRYGDKSKSRLGACLRSLALQMACTNNWVRETLLEMRKDDLQFDNDNERTIWRKLFLSGIFQRGLPRHYWVIDALDECVNAASFFDPMLLKLDDSTPLRVLITSRETPELEKHFFSLSPHRFQSEDISTTDTLSDIKLLVETKATSLSVRDEDDRADLVHKILQKSKGSFLWAVLVLNEMSSAFGEEEIKQVLDDVPRGMEPLYQRTLELMSQATRGKTLAKSILTWAACSIRPLTLKELGGALKLHVKDSVPKLEKCIAALCGQLVTVDKFGKVHMVHETAREFLVNDNLESEFAINTTEAHTQIARTCLSYLVGEEMKPLRTSRRASATTTADRRAEFSLYACAAFSDHLAHADALADDILILVERFLKSNVLSWIEVIATTQSLAPLILAAKNLRTYHNARAAKLSPLGAEMQTVRGWTTDLVRLAAKFADALVTSPSAVYSIIVPFCPTESAVFNTATPGRRLAIVGLSNRQWDDRLSCITFRQGQPSAVCHGDDFFAVGLTTGTVALYHTTSCQEYKVLDHGEAVSFLEFKSKSDLMASCGMKTIRVWNVRSGELCYRFQAPQRPVGLVFDKNLLIAASYQNYLASWDLENEGAEQTKRPWNGCGEHMNTLPRRPPCAISISVGHRMLAVAHSGRPITLWDLDEDAYYGSCGKKLPNGETSAFVVTALVFNPNPAIGLLAASYLDGELVLLDPFEDRDLESLRANCHILAASPDGRLLAGGAGSGTIEIYEFDTLKLLYRVKSSNLFIKQLAFSRDSFHFADIRGSQCNIWEPSVLLRDTMCDDSSKGTSTSLVEVVTSDTKVKISAMVLHPNGEVVFCGKDDGAVSLYDLKTGAQVRTLYRHKSLVRLLTWWPEAKIIMSVDVSNRIFAWRLKKLQKEGWVAEKILFQTRLDCGTSIIQVLPGEAAGKFILSTRESDHLWSIDGQQEDAQTYTDRPRVRKWIQHQQSPHHMICIDGAVARIYAWSDWSEVEVVSLAIDTTGLLIESVIPYASGHRQRLLLEFSELSGSAELRRLHLLDTAPFSSQINRAKRAVCEAASVGKNADTVFTGKETTEATIAMPLLGPQLAVLARRVAHVLGVGDAGKLIFLDTYSWVCSVDLESLSNSRISYARHFFVPYDWLAGTRDVISAVANRNVLFARNDEVAILKGGLEYAEDVNVEIGSAERTVTRGCLGSPRLGGFGFE